MKLTVKRFADNSDTTLGILFIDGVFECFTVEDEERQTKVMGETRVPNGTYDIKLRSVGGFHNRYSAKYGSMHKGMLCVHNKPNWILENAGMSFQYILIHTGNTDEHTSGCLIIGDSQENNQLKKDGFIGRSTQAYKRIYPPIAEALENGEEVTITYIDYDQT